MKKHWSAGQFTIKVMCNPGSHLGNEEFEIFHGDLVSINERSGANINNRMLNPKLSLFERRELFSQVVISVFYKNNTPCAFSMSPFLKKGNLKLLHIGLTMIAENPGFNLGGFLGVFNAMTAYEKYGAIYLTNISSTPSLVESFSEALGNAYPAPNSSLKKRPKYYRDIVQLLKEGYMDRCFPDKEKLHVDYKRFVLISNSSEMGFKTNFHSTSFANDMKYNNFCKTWINYDREEDLIQVGQMKKWQYIKMSAALLYFKYSFKIFSKTFGEQKVDDNISQSYEENQNSAAA